MNRRSRTLLTVTAAGALALAGCKSGKSSEAPAKQDHHPAPEGRVTVDQSAVLPVDVRAGVQRDFPGAAVTNVNKRTYDDRVVRFEVHVTTKDGRQHVREYNADGKPAASPATRPAK